MGTVGVGRHGESVVSNVGSFIANLPEMLGAMVEDPRCLVTVVEFEDVRYVQFLVHPDGAIVAEVVSNLNLSDALALSPNDEDALRSAGWSEPSPGATPNWRFEANGEELMQVVAMSRDAVYNVLRERDANAVSVRIWEGRRVTRPSDASGGPTGIHGEGPLRELERSLRDD